MNSSNDIIFTTYTGNDLTNKQKYKISDNIFFIFRKLRENPELQHTREEIYNNLSNNNSILIVAVIRINNNYQIVGLLLATPVQEIPNLLHIYYIYTAADFRNVGIATKLLEQLYGMGKRNKYTKISLTYDTYDNKLTKFYFRNQFYFDPTLRSYKRYDMLVRAI